MKMMWIISLFLLAFTVDLGLCCSCMTTHIQNAYCSSSLVIRGKAIKRRERRNIEITTLPYPLELPVTPVPHPDPWDMMKIFHVDVIEVIKAPRDANIKTGDVIEAVTNAHENMCGGYLPLNTELLITGGVNEKGQMTFGHCSYQKPFRVLSNFQLEGLQGGYSCDCRVHTWYSNNPDRECRINVNPDVNDSECLHKYGRCVLENNKCVWVVDPEASCYYSTTPQSPRTTPPQ